MNVFITGIAGFIGFHVAKSLLCKGFYVYGIDNFNDYYDPKLKRDRVRVLEGLGINNIQNMDLNDVKGIESLLDRTPPHYVIHLAAQAGVRYSITNPDTYIDSNIHGFYSIINLVIKYKVINFLYASSSSVYGNSINAPFLETDIVDFPLSLYAATKKANELIAHTYSYIHSIPTIGMRFFTVYGPFGRPDMAYFSFLDSYFKNQPIRVYNNRNFDNDLIRDFTYIDDIVDAVIALMKLPPKKDVPYEVFNIGNSHPEKLMDFIRLLEIELSNVLGKQVKFNIEYESMKKGDVYKTFASSDKLFEYIGFSPKITLSQGIQQFVKWYADYFRI
jgi:UDP-glucuronate 4-epimerase